MTRPLRRLEDAAAAVGDGISKLARPNGGPPEVRSLAAAFNETVAKL